MVLVRKWVEVRIMPLHVLKVKNTFRYLGVCLNMVRLSKFDWKEAEEKMGKNAYLER